MSNDIDMEATDLTQLSSREQLSALMDGALPPDQTRFLLRRLRHDAPLAECWERWRLSAEVMRGLAPAQRLPAEFALNVAASLRGDDVVDPAASATRTSAVRAPAWARWGGGAAVAASLAVAAVMTWPAAVPAPATGAAAVAIAQTASQAASGAPAPKPSAQDPTGNAMESQTAALATAVVVAARPSRGARRGGLQARANEQVSMPGSQAVATRLQESQLGIAAHQPMPTLLPQVDGAPRPWPRSVLSEYGNHGITVGFGDSARGAAPYNPFQVRTSIGGLPPSLIIPAASQGASAAPSSQAVDDNSNGSEATQPEAVRP